MSKKNWLPGFITTRPRIERAKRLVKHFRTFWAIEAKRGTPYKDRIWYMWMVAKVVMR